MYLGAPHHPLSRSAHNQGRPPFPSTFPARSCCSILTPTTCSPSSVRLRGCGIILLLAIPSSRASPFLKHCSPGANPAIASLPFPEVETRAFNPKPCPAGLSARARQLIATSLRHQIFLINIYRVKLQHGGRGEGWAGAALLSGSCSGAVSTVIAQPVLFCRPLQPSPTAPKPLFPNKKQHPKNSHCQRSCRDQGSAASSFFPYL